MSFVFTLEILSRLFLMKLFASILPVVPSRLITFLRLSRALCCNKCSLLTFRDMWRFRKARKSAFEFKGAVDELRNLDPVQPFVLSISIKGRSLSLSFSTSDYTFLNTALQKEIHTKRKYFILKNVTVLIIHFHREYSCKPSLDASVITILRVLQ